MALTDLIGKCRRSPKRLTQIAMRTSAKAIPFGVARRLFPGRIYDCFSLLNELDLLEIRLKTLTKYVDYFVIVESPRTFSDKKKPLNYFENKDRYKEFWDKIIHVVVDDLPRVAEHEGNRWVLCQYQKNQVARALSGCGKNDIIISSDIDEIPNPARFGEIICLLNTVEKVVLLYQKHYRYFLNGLLGDEWPGPRALTYGTLKSDFNLECDQLRARRFFPVKNGGWHFSNMGGIDNVLYKVESCCHSEFDLPEYKNKDELERKVELGLPTFGIPGFDYVRLDGTFPEVVTRDIGRYRHLIKKV